jgi:hypothetical protein
LRLQSRVAARISRVPTAPALVGAARPPNFTVRALSSNASGGENNDSNEKKNSDAADDDSASDTNKIVRTPGEQVVYAGRNLFRLAIGGFAAACACYITKELFPT